MEEIKQKGSLALRAFWKGRGEKRGGQVELYSYATYIGRAGGNFLHKRSGLLYACAARFWFESVASDDSLFGFIIKGSTQPAAPLELDFSVEEIEGAQLVPEQLAESLCAMDAQGLADFGEIEGLGKKSGLFFSNRALMFTLADGRREFFQLTREKEFLEFI